jgi:multidrug resistance efflux pump
MKKYSGRNLKNSGFILGVILLVCIGTTGCNQTNQASNTTPEVASKTVEAYGVVKSTNQLDIVLEFPASIEHIIVSEGQKIAKDEAIAKLNLDDYNLQIKSKDIELKISGKEKAKILSETSIGLSGDPTYQKLQDSLRLAKTNLVQAEKDLETSKSLLASGAVSQKEYDQYKLSYDQKMSAKIGLEKDIAQYEKSKKGVSSSVDIKDLQATATSLSLAHMKDKLTASYMKGNQVVSPFKNAVVYDIGYEDGALISATKKLCSLADMDALIVEADVTEDFIAEVQLGAEVTIIPVADRSKEYHGKVTRIANMAKVENGETLISVEITINDNDGFLKPNYNVDLSIMKK